MNDIPICLYKKIGDYLKEYEKIYLYLCCKEAYSKYFVPYRTVFKNSYINNYKLCTVCFKRCYKENKIISLCNCLGNYSVRHYNCRRKNSKFNGSIGVTNCQFCDKKIMEFCKMYRTIA